LKISTKGRYALEAVLELATISNSKHVSLKEISEKRNISETYLEQIFVKLRKNNVVISVRGAQGGYMLAKPPGEITVLDVVTAVEGELSSVKCTAAGGSESCSIYNDCMTKDFWREVTDCINDTLRSTTVGDLLDEKNELESNVAYEYFI
jgi:Rrf2 family transcriptional regulator, cysteine metabolism repressor